MDKYNSFFNTQKKPSSIFGEVGTMDILLENAKILDRKSLEKQIQLGRRTGEFGSSFLIQLGVYSLEEQHLISNLDLVDKVYEFVPSHLKKPLDYEFFR